MQRRRNKISQRRKVGKKPLDERLKRPSFAAQRLNAILRKNDSRLLVLGLRDVARHFGMSRLARTTGLNRENLYKMLDVGKNPGIGSIMKILSAFGFKIQLICAKPGNRKSF